MQRPMQVQQQQQPYPFGGVAPSRPVALQGSLYAIQQGMASQPPAQPPPAMRPGFPDARTAASIGSPATPTFSETSSRPGGRKKKDDETFYPEPVVSSPGTLIICPLSTVTNWEEQIAQHCRPGTVGAYVYHGGGRNQSAEQLSLHDVVITTYNVLSIEYGRMARAGSNARNDAEGGFLAPLHAIEWHRVVLDEAHTIKDASTAQSKAACSINARRRWCLTGTPIQNKLDDLYALIKFLRVQPFDEKLAWTTTFTRPLRSADPIGVSRLQTLMKLVTIRRTKTMKIKGQPIVSLPPREDRVESVELGPFERKLYDAAHRQSKEIFERLVQNDNVMRNYVHVLEILLRLRQLVTHPGLVKRSQIDFANLKLEESSVIDLSDESAVDAAQSWETYNLLRDSGEDYCCRCQEQVVDATSGDVDPRYAARAPVVSRCGHLYCKGCVEAGLKQNAFECRMCSRIVTTTDVLELNEASLEAVTKQTMAKAEKTIKLFMKGPNGTTADATITVDPNKLELLSPYDESAKVRAIIADLRQVRLDAQTAGTEMPKSVIFSQWTGMLDILQNHLTYHEFGFTRLDGKMSRPDRSAAIQTFRSDPDCTVMLVSLKAGGVGLNLTMASRAYLVEPYWNPSVENQAVDRIHRMGQTKPVTTIRLIVKDSVEDNILALQKKKLALANMALERDERGKGKGTSAQQKEEMARQRLKDLKELFK
ncbi:SNF2 family N-terminal domain-containing protein [Hyaloraphidium curvatum]|nr:SNF2 family N-terminal domain-containing protein [Hyaloraphidium curvatum]